MGSSLRRPCRLPIPCEGQWRQGKGSHLQWRDRTGFSPVSLLSREGPGDRAATKTAQVRVVFTPVGRACQPRRTLTSPGSRGTVGGAMTGNVATKADISGLRAEMADRFSVLYRRLWIMAIGIVGFTASLTVALVKLVL